MLSAVHTTRTSNRRALVGYFGPPEDQLEDHPQIRNRLAWLAPDYFASKGRGLQVLALLCFSALRLDTQTRIFRRHA